MKNDLWIHFIAALLFWSTGGYAQKRELQRYETEFSVSAVSYQGSTGPAGRSTVNLFGRISPKAGFNTGFWITSDLIASIQMGYILYGGEEKVGANQAFQHILRMDYFIIGDRRNPVSGAVYNRRGMINNYRRFYLYAFAGTGGALSKSRIPEPDISGGEALIGPGFVNIFQYGYIFPMGAGIRFTLDSQWSIGAEAGYQFSTSALPDENSLVTSVRAIFRLRNSSKGMPLFAYGHR